MAGYCPPAIAGLRQNWLVDVPITRPLSKVTGTILQDVEIIFQSTLLEIGHTSPVPTNKTVLEQNPSLSLCIPLYPSVSLCIPPTPCFPYNSTASHTDLTSRCSLTFPLVLAMTLHPYHTYVHVIPRLDVHTLVSSPPATTF